MVRKYLAFAYEVMARANAVAGKKSDCKKYYELAKTAIDQIKDSEDKKILDSTLIRLESQKSLHLSYLCLNWVLCGRYWIAGNT